MFSQEALSLSREISKTWKNHPDSRAVRLDKHFHAAKRHARGIKKLHKIMDILADHPKGKRVSVKYLDEINSAIDCFDSSRCLLDSHYHDIISDSEFMKWGHIYYNEGGKKCKRGK